MKHPYILKTAAITFAAASISMFSYGGEEPPIAPGPRLGLEVFDDGTPVRPPASRYGAAAEESSDKKKDALEGKREDVFSEPTVIPQRQQPPYRAPDVRRPPVVPMRPVDTETSSQVGGADDPFANLGDSDSSESEYTAQPQQPPRTTVQRQPAPSQYPAQPVPQRPVPVVPQYSVLDNLNISNAFFPGLNDAVRANSIPGASQIIWNTLRQRQMQGAYGFSTISNPQRVHEVLTMMPPVAQDPLQAAQRINVIIDAFQSSAVTSPSFGAMMPQVLTSLNSDLTIIQYALGSTLDDGEFLELARTYVRTMTTCDFFAFSRRQLATDIRQITNRSVTMFYPDGSSRGGDVAGITSNLFHIMFMLDRYSQDDGWFKRDIGPITRTLDKPGSFVSALACPDGSLPNFGPRGTRELLPVEVKVLEEVYPKIHPRMYRIGLAGSNSFPQSSRDRNYSGIYVMRDIEGRAGRYLAMRFGPVGNLSGVPAHGDFGSLFMMSRGVKYLADPGGYGGLAATPLAHGGVSVNGQYPTAESYTPPGEPSNAVWRTNASIDYVTASSSYPDKKIWQRSALYVKDLPGETKTDYWLILDHIDMRDAPETAKAVIRFPLAPGVTAQREGPGIIMTGPNNTGTAMRVFAADAGVRFGVGSNGRAFDVTGGSSPTQTVTIERDLSGSLTTATVFYPADDRTHRPRRIERDSDIIRGRTGVIVVDHGMERIDVIAWAPPKTELVTPTLNLQMSADLGVFRLRKGKIARIDFVNLERFQAKEPDGGLWSTRVHGPAQTLTIEKEFGGSWQILSDPDNRSGASLEDVNFGPATLGKRLSIRPGEIRPVW